MEAGIPKNVLFRFARSVSCIPVPKWKVCHHACVRLALVTALESTLKGTALNRFGLLAKRSICRESAAMRMSVKHVDRHLFTSQQEGTVLPL